MNDNSGSFRMERASVFILKFYCPNRSRNAAFTLAA